MRPGLEPLEGRRVPATFAVNTLLDTVAVNLQDGMDAAGHASLLPAIMAANARPGADTILVPNGTIRLTIAGADEDAARGDLDSRLDLAPSTADRAGPGCPSVSPRTPPRPASRRNKKQTITWSQHRIQRV